MLVPTAVLAFLLLAVLVALASITPVEDRKYLAALEREISRFEPQARKEATLKSSIDQTRARAKLLDGFRRRSKRTWMCSPI